MSELSVGTMLAWQLAAVEAAHARHQYMEPLCTNVSCFDLVRRQQGDCFRHGGWVCGDWEVEFSDSPHWDHARGGLVNL